MSYQIPVPDEDCVAILEDLELNKPIIECFGRIQEKVEHNELSTTDKIQYRISQLQEEIKNILDSTHDKIRQVLEIKPDDSKETKLNKARAGGKVLKYMREVIDWIQKVIENIVRKSLQIMKSEIDHLSGEFGRVLRLLQGYINIYSNNIIICTYV